MLALAISLSDAGIGDYWDDVDHFVRNHLAEHQLIDRDRLHAIADHARATKPARGTSANSGAAEDVVERTVGAFGEGTPSTIGPWMGVQAAGCCTGNGALGLYYGWEATVRHQDGLATVNLLLNRASPWVDVNSHLPYEGRVVVTNKTANAIAVRIPGWATICNTQVTVDGETVSPLRVGRYLTVSGLKPDQVVELQLDVPDDRSTYDVRATKYTFDFRGSTVVGVSPRVESLDSYPLYMREHMRTGRAPLKKVKRFVSGRYR
jgi:hypothetical protein